jgi:uncharacterized membrane protein
MGRKFILYLDIIILVLLSILLLFYKSLVLSIVFLFFAPGYLLVNLLFPDVWKPGYGLRVVMSVGVSTVVVGLLGLFHGYFIADRFPILATFAIFNGVLGILVISRRHSFGKPESMEFLKFPLIKAGFWQIVKLISIFIVIIIFAYFLRIEGSQQSEFTEFYILGSKGLAADYPVEVILKTPSSITVGITNQEGAKHTYTVIALINDMPVGIISEIAIEEGESWEGQLTMVIHEPGDGQRIEILLSNENYDFPYRSLIYWVDVIQDE